MSAPAIPQSLPQQDSLANLPSARMRRFLPDQGPKPANRMDQYEIIEVIGRGGMGIVVKARDTVLERIVAIKVLGLLLDKDPDGRKLFMREARSAASVNHQHVVSIYGFGGLETDPYLVMEYVDGNSLQDYLAKSGPLPVEEIIEIGVQIADGLAAAHAKGLVHRDIKPANILLEKETRQVKITDFGLARAVNDAALTRTGGICGTAEYMAPEQAQGDKVDHRADLFSLGTVLYEMCTGDLPFHAPNTMAVLKRVCEEQPKRACECNGDIPEWLADLITRLHVKNPAMRIQSAAEVADALRRRQAPPAVATTIRVRPNKERETKRRTVFSNRHLFIGAALAAMLIVAISAASALALFAVGFGRFPGPPPKRPGFGGPHAGKNGAFVAIDEEDRNCVLEIRANNHISCGFLRNAGLKIHYKQGNRMYQLGEGKHTLPAGDYCALIDGLPPGFSVTPRDFVLKPQKGTSIEVHHQPRYGGYAPPFAPRK